MNVTADNKCYNQFSLSCDRADSGSNWTLSQFKDNNCGGGVVNTITSSGLMCVGYTDSKR